MHKAQRTAIDIVEYGKLVIIAMIMIAVVYFIAKELVGQVPAIIGSIIIGIVMVFIYATNKTVRDNISSWLNRKK